MAYTLRVKFKLLKLPHCYFVGLLLLASIQLQGQSQEPEHHQEHAFRISMLIGHGMVPETEEAGLYFVPTWIMDLDFHLSPNWSIGLHSDLELENYKVRRSETEVIEIRTPWVSSLDLFYRFHPNMAFGIGPGITRENQAYRWLFRAGWEGEIPINSNWEAVATIFFDHRIDGHKVWTLGIGVAYYL